METQIDIKEAVSAVPDEYCDEDRLVLGDGDFEARIMLIGEAPGEFEVEQGKPFVGRSGSILEDTLAEAGVSREEVYITNLVKVRPPDNRDPHKDEISAWKDVVTTEISVVRPSVVITLGRIPTRNLVDTSERISDVRGSVFEVEERVVIPTYHPAATLYDPTRRDSFEEDVRFAIDKGVDSE